MKFSGVWIPLVTPFVDNDVDYQSLAALVEYYVGKGVAGLIPLATTGEASTIADDEYFKILEKTLGLVNGRLPVVAGVGGNDTRRVAAKMKALEKYPLAGALIPCPYYNRPDQRGIYEHFRAIAEASKLTILVYNIPYRTGRNIENKTIRRLATIPTVRGLKDSCGDIRQSMELLLDPPPDFSILVGEDILYFDSLCLGACGGILASAHLATERFVGMYEAVRANDLRRARDLWRTLAPVIPLLFEEPNPAPIKCCLKKLGLIRSDEVRLPLTGYFRRAQGEAGRPAGRPILPRNEPLIKADGRGEKTCLAQRISQRSFERASSATANKKTERESICMPGQALD